ncbi:MAG: hypothetical protein KatS3mg104_1128 [Phycisphaerae bacterium]|nr:MAG: hypothetical protein KatS3mg104_1128 [Phycisphaerae bacterium]
MLFVRRGLKSRYREDKLPFYNSSVKISMDKSNKQSQSKDQFQTFSKPKIKVARVTAKGKLYVDYKDTESLKKLMSGNGKMLSRKRSGATAAEQRMISRAIKRARYMALLPFTATAM